MNEMTVAQLRKSHPFAAIEHHEVHLEWLKEVLRSRYPKYAISMTDASGVPLLGFVPNDYCGVNVNLALEFDLRWIKLESPITDVLGSLG